MKTHIKYIILLFSILGCSNSVIENTEEPLLEKIESIYFSCVGPWNLTDSTNYIINTNEEYEEALGNHNLWDDSLCSDRSLPPIDFQNNTLIGFNIATSGCSVPAVERTIEIKESMIYVNYKITRFGSCLRANYVYDWFTIPKIKDENHIIVKLKYKRE